MASPDTDPRHSRLPSPSPWIPKAEAYHRHLESGRDPFQDEVNSPDLIRLFPKDEGLRALDIACGNGRFTEMMCTSRPSWSIEAFDIADKLIEHARERGLTSVNFQVHDALETFPFPEESFDVAVCKMLFPSLPDIRPVVREAWRILKPEGTFIVSTFDWRYQLKYLASRSQTTFDSMYYFVYRNMLATLYTLYGRENALSMIGNLAEEYLESFKDCKDAVWASVAGSEVIVPTFIHDRDKLAQVFAEENFALVEISPVYVDQQFAARHESYLDRVGQQVHYNIKFKKAPLE